MFLFCFRFLLVDFGKLFVTTYALQLTTYNLQFATYNRLEPRTLTKLKTKNEALSTTDLFYSLLLFFS